MPVQPTSAARQRRFSGLGVLNSPTPNTGAASLDRGHRPQSLHKTAVLVLCHPDKTQALNQYWAR